MWGEAENLCDASAGGEGSQDGSVLECVPGPDFNANLDLIICNIGFDLMPEPALDNFLGRRPKVAAHEVISFRPFSQELLVELFTPSLSITSIIICTTKRTLWEENRPPTPPHSSPKVGYLKSDVACTGLPRSQETASFPRATVGT